MLTTSEAAEVLGVTPRRVVALVESGALVAERFGRQWMVDERSVRDRASAPKLSGRPKLGQKDLLALSAHTLMNRDHPVLDFTYDRKQKRARIERVHDEALWGPSEWGGGRGSPAKAGALRFPTRWTSPSGSNPHLSDEAVSRMAHHVQRNIDAVNDLYAERAR